MLTSVYNGTNSFHSSNYGGDFSTKFVNLRRLQYEQLCASLTYNIFLYQQRGMSQSIL